MITLIFPHALLRIYNVICLRRSPRSYLSGTVEMEEGRGSSPSETSEGPIAKHLLEFGDLGSRCEDKLATEATLGW